MQKDSINQTSRLAHVNIVVSLFITGLGIGWFVGLSVSPVVSIVIASVAGSAAALVATLSGLEGKPAWNVNPLPLAILVVGLLIGSIVGLQARNQDWFGQDVLAVEVRKWQQLGLPEREIVRQLFNSTYSAGNGGSPQESSRRFSSTVLFADTMEEECEELRFLEEENLWRRMAASTVPEFRRLAEIVTEPDVLWRLVEEFLCIEEP